MSYYEEVEFPDLTYDPTLEIYHFPCPCGDRFEIALADMRDGYNVGRCPSCSLEILVLFDASDLPEEKKQEETKQSSTVAAAA